MGALLIGSASQHSYAESRALDLRAERDPVSAPGATASPGLRLNGAGLRRDDVERAIWLIEDLGHLSRDFAQGEVNKHAKANWTVLHENYVTAAGKLAELWDKGGIVVADLPPQRAATLRDGKIIIDPLLDGGWRSDVVARERQVGGDDWSHISQLAGVLLQQLGRLQAHADWPWFQTHLRRSAALTRARVDGDPEAAAALVRFGHLKDKHLLLSLLSTSAATAELRDRWSARRNAMSQEVNDFLDRQASVLGSEAMSAMAREWTDYGQSAQRLSQTRAQAARRFPVPLLRPAAGGAASTATPARVTQAPRASGGLADTIEDAPERLKFLSPSGAAVAGGAASPSAATDPGDTTGASATAEEAQVAAWRDDLAARQYQSGGVTIRIDGPPEPPLATPEEDFDKFARVGDMAFRLLAPAAGRSEGGTPDRVAESSSDLLPETPEASDQVSAQAPAQGQAQGQTQGQAGGQAGGQGEQAESPGSIISIWLTSAADQVGAVISLIAFLLLATPVLLIILWIWLSERRRAMAEPPIILSVLADDEPIDLQPAPNRGRTVDAADWVRVDSPNPEGVAKGAMQGAEEARFADAPNPLADDYSDRPLDAGDLDESGAGAGISEDHDERLPARQSAPLPAEDLEDDGETTPQDLVSALRAGHKSQFEIGLQRLTGLSASDIKAVIAATDGEALATICRALDVDELLFASIFMTLRRQYHDEHEVPPHQLSRAIAAFAQATPEDAQRQVERWVTDAEFIVVDEAGDRSTAFG